MALLRRDMEFGALLRISIVTALAQALFSILFVVLGLSYLGLAAAGFAGAVATLVAASLFRVKYRLFTFRFTQWRPIWYFSSRSTSTSLISTFGSMSPDLIIGKLLGFEAVGLFSRAVGIVQLVERGIMDAVRSVALPFFSACHRNQEPPTAIYTKSMALVLAASWPSQAFLAIAAGPVISILYGDQWISAAPLVTILIVGAAARNVATLLGSLLIAGGHVGALPPRHLVWEATKVILIIAAVPWGLLGVASAYAASEIIGTALFIHAGRVRLSIAWRIQRAVLAQALVVVLITASAGGLASVATIDSSYPLLQLLAVATATVIAWLLAIRTTGHPLWHEITKLPFLRKHTPVVRKAKRDHNA